MRKKKLIEEMDFIIEKNNNLYNRCKELENKLHERSCQIDELTASIAEVVAENELLKSELKSKTVTDSVDCVNPFSVADISGISKVDDSNSVNEDAEVNREESEASSIKTSASNIEPVEYTSAFIAEEKIKAASKSIGRVVLECTKLCNTFAAIGDINSKDLINLALGRTEVFKSEVLQLATEKKSACDIENQLKSKEQAVFEYFELLKNQT
ncbi:MAG: hypothetical protein J6Q76_06165 [Clostridia bacterium]|nr:hypothetical protein [Clostridia bacterium]